MSQREKLSVRGWAVKYRHPMTGEMVLTGVTVHEDAAKASCRALSLAEEARVVPVQISEVEGTAAPCGAGNREKSMSESIAVGRFSYMRADAHWQQQRWIIHDDNTHFAGEFSSEVDAKAACERWSNSDGHLLTVDWESAPEDADDSHRGYYRVRLDGCRGEKVFCSGWHTMEACARFCVKFRDLIAEHGIEAARAFWKAMDA